MITTTTPRTFTPTDVRGSFKAPVCDIIVRLSRGLGENLCLDTIFVSSNLRNLCKLLYYRALRSTCADARCYDRGVGAVDGATTLACEHITAAEHTDAVEVIPEWQHVNNVRRFVGT